MTEQHASDELLLTLLIDRLEGDLWLNWKKLLIGLMY